MFAARATGRFVLPIQTPSFVRNASHISPAPGSFGDHSHRVVVVGGGTAGLAISHQLLRSGKFTQDEIAVVDPAAWHHYQPGWTLVGGGLKDKQGLRRPLQALLNRKLKFYPRRATTFSPEANSITLDNGHKIAYEHLVVAPGIEVKYGSIKGLSEALADPSSLISTIYGYDYCDKTYETIRKFRKGSALFTHPAGTVKCAGAPQKIMWLALDYWKKAGLYSSSGESPIHINFATNLPGLFGVPKYSTKLDELRRQRGVDGYFQHDLVAIEGNQATFAVQGQPQKVTKSFDLLHVVPKMGPYDTIKTSTISNEDGFVEVDEATTRHKRYANIWSAGDASSLPTSKTMAAVTSQAPVLVRNMLQAMEGKVPDAVYDGYTSCPLLTEYGKVLLAEFKYGGEPDETFNRWFGIDQGTPRRAFYYLKKDFFPWVYYKSMLKGTWRGPKGWSR
ncbi:NAD(P)/FAD-dependent oxidoreductase [Aspergillus melleus]|uniref:NAD(P)/FAD-dependent oxidoreductase n=1 Tax=Aspergillus melleus TaxID=138277 RepID=UPI001E8D35C9|nr:uncharacterized protein LDX57_007155 [Aspergillus melleus]KAH8429493.1 hypothetical protein LDX57_007155 [Aspergillus melleus]